MDIQDYISSGIIESYILGNVSTQEKQEVECMSHIYPEIQEELKFLQSTMEMLAKQGAVSPPEHLKFNILAAIEGVSQDKEESEVVEERILDEEKVETKVIALNPSFVSKSVWRYVAAASIIGFAVSTSFLISNNRQVELYSSELSVLKEKNETVEKSLQALLEQKNKVENANRLQMEFLSDPNTIKVLLKGTGTHLESQTVVYWNSENKKGFIKVNYLPVAGIEQDYQLWALVDGKPVDMGVVSINTKDNSLQEIPEIDGAQAFAVTLEKKGGSPTPNLDQLFVIGNI